MKWMTVADVRMNKMTEHAYSCAIKAAIDTCNKDHSCDLVKSLKGITDDWSSAQLRGIKQVFGEERVDELLRGCKVHFMRAVHRVAEKMCNAGTEHRLFITLAAQLPKEASKDQVYTIFSCLKGETQLCELPERNLTVLPSSAESTDTSTWVRAMAWVQWWTKPTHLRMLSPAFSSMDSAVQWTSMPSDTNGVESLNKGQIQLINPSPSLDQEKEKLLSVMKVTLKISTKRTKSLRKRERPSHPSCSHVSKQKQSQGCTRCQKYIALNSNTLQLALEQESKWLVMMGKNTLWLSLAV